MANLKSSKYKRREKGGGKKDKEGYLRNQWGADQCKVSKMNPKGTLDVIVYGLISTYPSNSFVQQTY